MNAVFKCILLFFNVLLFMPSFGGKLFIRFPFRTNCSPPKGNICIEIFNCPYFANLLKTTEIPRPRYVLDLIRDYQCGFGMSIPQVCCFQETITYSPQHSDKITTAAFRTIKETTTPIPSIADSYIRDSNTNVDLHTIKDRANFNLASHKNYALLPHKNCGHISDGFRITSGDTAAVGEFPWMALVIYKTENGLDFRCGGTLINEQYILTAAHCILNSSIEGVRLGEYNLGSESDCEGGHCAPPVQDFYINRSLIHAAYDENSIQNDIALIRLEKPVNLSNPNVQPICLPFQSYNLNGKNVTVSGWGVTENGFRSSQPKKTRIPVVPLEECRKTYQQLTNITSNQICAGGKEGKDTCDGDSGGPLKHVATINGVARYIQYGIVSYGPRYCGAENQPAIYTRVSSYLEWILDNIESSGS